MSTGSAITNCYYYTATEYVAVEDNRVGVSVTASRTYTLTLADGAKVTVKLGSRALKVGDKVIDWTTQPDATFKGKGYTFESRSDGLYVAGVPGGFTIIVR